MSALLGHGGPADAGGFLDLAAAVGEWAIPAFWLPVFLWTLWAGLGLWALGRRRATASLPLHPGAAYRVGQVLVFMLPVVLLARGWAPDAVRGLDVSDLAFPVWGADSQVQAPIPAVRPEGARPMVDEVGSVLPTLEPPAEGGGAPGRPEVARGQVSASFGEGAPESGPGIALISALGLLLAVVVGAVGTGTFVSRLSELVRLRGMLEPVRDAGLRDRLESSAEALGLGGRIDWRVGPPQSVPMTFGVRLPVVALPSSVLSDEAALDLAVRHELVHVKRGDFAWAMAESLISVVFSFHPLVRRLVDDLGDDRERSCDLAVVAATDAPRRYGELLIRMAGRPKASLLVAAGMSPSSTKLKERLETMSRFNGRSEQRGPRAYGVLTMVTGVAVAFLAACAGDASEPPVPEAEMAAESFTTRFGPMSDDTREEALQRLDLQVGYLIEEMDAIESEGVFNDHVSARYQLLKSMYVERLEQYETLRMEAEVNRQLGVS